MNAKEARSRLKKITGMMGDDESAHGAEDDLYADVLQSIADGTCEDPKAVARIVLQTKALTFARWCA